MAVGEEPEEELGDAEDECDTGAEDGDFRKEDEVFRGMIAGSNVCYGLVDEEERNERERIEGSSG